MSRRYNVPVSAIMQANSISDPTAIHPGEHLVIPRLKSRATSAAVMPPMGPIGAPKTALAPTSGVHIVAPGETLHSIARFYGKPVMVLAKANNIPPDTMVRVGERLVIPDIQPGQLGVAAPRAQASAAPAPASVPVAAPGYASAESPHSARVATPEPAPATEQQNAVKTAEPAGSLPSFRWPARGRVIAGFGPSPNGLQNDGINVAVPEGTPIKAADDGVVAYAGNELKGYGNLVLVRHSNGFVTAYAHASEILVKRGDTVKRGEVIAKSGQTGNVTSPQLHFEIRKGSTPVDPAQYLNGA
jgi:murein DD-endopeptidase MepM/ murein hydrolase activator NlpD